MPPEKRGGFAYWLDPVFLISLAAYIINRALIKPHLYYYSPLFHGHLDDTLTVPVALPLYLLAYRWIGLRPDDDAPRWWEVAIHLTVWIFFFKWFGPVILLKGAEDPVDAWCMAFGGIFAWAIWHVRMSRWRALPFR